ncbi:MAG TPA: alpha/beta hydrolase [Steroidobacteraceae bacterium]|jgi:dienelactone hydrolase|nr:alpha/beta hydrolase [Steroidobacteraceae bacterium]
MRQLSQLAAIACGALLLGRYAHAESTPADCHVGAYRLADTSLLDIAPGEGDSLRWRRFDGTSGALHSRPDGRWASTYGWTDRPDGHSASFAACTNGEIQFDGLAGRRIDFDVTETKFQGRGVELAGRLVMPRGSAPLPIAVLVHGAEHTSARDSYALQRMLPAEGVGVFVYDKRGTGASGGRYSQDFDLLADDAVAAMREARRLAGARTARIGYQGGSEGGWVVPLAAARAAVDFAVVSFGLAVSVIDEDQQEVALEMSLKGHGPREIAAAQEVAAAAEAVIASGFTTGFKRFDAVRARYRDEPWYKDVHGNYTWALLPYSEAELRAKAKAYDWGTPFRYDPMPTLRALDVAQLWVLGEDDLDAPSAETSRRIRTLQAEGRPITLALFPHAEHGLTEYEFNAAGERVSTRYSAGYFAMMRDFMRSGELPGTYGASVITRPAAAAGGAAGGPASSHR